MDTVMIIKLVILIGAALLLGYKLGRKKQQHPYGGEIVFSTQPDGHERCSFMLEQDEAWLRKQESVLFKIEHGEADE